MREEMAKTALLEQQLSFGWYFVCHFGFKKLLRDAGFLQQGKIILIYDNNFPSEIPLYLFLYCV